MNYVCMVYQEEEMEQDLFEGGPRVGAVPQGPTEQDHDDFWYDYQFYAYLFTLVSAAAGLPVPCNNLRRFFKVMGNAFMLLVCMLRQMSNMLVKRESKTSSTQTDSEAEELYVSKLGECWHADANCRGISKSQHSARTLRPCMWCARPC